VRRGSTMRIFLSYANEDADIAGVVSERLQSAGHVVFNWKAEENQDAQFIEVTQDAIKNADYFLALLSQSYLASSWCRQERNYALTCENGRNGSVPFIHVLLVSDVHPRDAGYLGNYSWRDVTRPEQISVALDALNKRISPAHGARRAPSGPAIVAATATRHSGDPVFRNRENEVEQVLRGLTNAAGPHFWLVDGPPQLGKTWFLERISKDGLLAESPGWMINRIDLRDLSPEERSDPDALLGLMFRRRLSVVDREVRREIAIEVIESRRPHLCLLDSGELLDELAVGRLRQHLGEIYQWVLAAGRAGTRLTMIISSRKDDGWCGLRPDPRLSRLSLTEFKVDVVQQAMREMAAETEAHISERDYWRYATLAHALTEGLPALLARCLQWVAAQQWTDLERMEDPGIFWRLAGPYIESDLLTSESLFPGDSTQGDDQLAAVRQAYRLLAPYRLFTQSHLRHHLERDPELTDLMGRLGWRLIDLWQAISSTALLIRKQGEPWQRIHPAVRRLLYRYFYPTDDGAGASSSAGGEAHREARRFIKVWAEKQVGTEQAVGLIECLWHDANIHLPDRPEEIISSARQLSADLQPSEAFTLGEMRDYAAQLMRGDDEFQRAISCSDGLLGQLVEIVLRP
jgi:TIR domain